MIGRLSGTLLEKQAPDLLVDVRGVAYEVQAPMSTFYRLPETGQAVLLHTHLVVREDAQLLFGFFDQHERRLFRTLIKVNGVGPKLALTILSGIEADQFVACVQANDTAALVKLPGVGRKTAERLLIELTDRLKDWAPEASQGETPTRPLTSGNILVQDAESALVALGYKPTEAAKAIAAVQTDEMESPEQIIRQALKSMVK